MPFHILMPQTNHFLIDTNMYKKNTSITETHTSNIFIMTHLKYKFSLLTRKIIINAYIKLRYIICRDSNWRGQVGDHRPFFCAHFGMISPFLVRPHFGEGYSSLLLEICLRINRVMWFRDIILYI